MVLEQALAPAGVGEEAVSIFFQNLFQLLARNRRHHGSSNPSQSLGDRTVCFRIASGSSSGRKCTTPEERTEFTFSGEPDSVGHTRAHAGRSWLKHFTLCDPEVDFGSRRQSECLTGADGPSRAAARNNLPGGGRSILETENLRIVGVRGDLCYGAAGGRGREARNLVLQQTQPGDDRQKLCADT